MLINYSHNLFCFLPQFCQVSGRINCLLLSWRLPLLQGLLYFRVMALALWSELCAISPGWKMSPWACCCRCLPSICMIFFFLFTVIISVLWGGSAGSVSEAGLRLYRQVILPLSLTHLELFRCYFPDSGTGRGEEEEAQTAGVTINLYLISIKLLNSIN